jgi:hypothetical protein
MREIFMQEKKLLAEILQDTCCKEEIGLPMGDASCRLQVGNIREHSYPVSLFYSHFESWKYIRLKHNQVELFKINMLCRWCGYSYI